MKCFYIYRNEISGYWWAVVIWLYGYICVNNRKQMESDNVALWRSALPVNLQLWSQHKHTCTRLLSSDFKPAEIWPIFFLS